MSGVILVGVECSLSLNISTLCSVIQYVPVYKAAVLLFQDWAMGVLHAKIICAITLMGPQWWLKRVIEQVST